MKSGFDISISLDDQNDHKLLDDILKENGFMIQP